VTDTHALQGKGADRACGSTPTQVDWPTYSSDVGTTVANQNLFRDKINN
jgi:hypothetical protein